MIKKIFLGLFLNIAIITNLYAESNGVFLGVGLGFVNRGEDVTINGNKNKYNSNDTFMGAIVGYKHYIGDSSFGLRYYFSVDSNFDAEKEDASTANFIDYDLNVDAMYNFTPNSSFIGVGLFAGAFAGVGTFNINASDVYVTNMQVASIEKKQFRSGVNFGLRLLLGNHNSIEVASKIPLISSEITQSKSNNLLPESRTFRENYSVLLRYVLSF